MQLQCRCLSIWTRARLAEDREHTGVKRLECQALFIAGNPGGPGRDQDDGRGRLLQDLASGFESVHHRHAQVHGNHVRLQQRGRAPGVGAVGGPTNHGQLRVSIDERHQHGSLGRRVVDHQYAHGLFADRRGIHNRRLTVSSNRPCSKTLLTM